MRQNRQRYQRRTGRLCTRLTAALLAAVMLFTMQGVCTLASTTGQVSENDAGNTDGMEGTDNTDPNGTDNIDTNGTDTPTDGAADTSGGYRRYE